MTLRIHPLGDSSLLCDAGHAASPEHQRRIWALAETARQWPQVLEAVPGVNNLLLIFDPLHADIDALNTRIERAWLRPVPAPAQVTRPIEIPVSYGGEAGPDLDEVARHAGLTVEEVIAAHSGAVYTVMCMGFQPGFAYLGGMDARLATPRRATPRTAVPAGAVAIGGPQTAVYPAASPGGWNLIGHTDTRLFNPKVSPPSLLKAGARVRFVPVSAQVQWS